MTDRELKGLQIAAKSRITQEKGIWRVPSQSGSGRYMVVMTGESPVCSCPDYELRVANCKHIFAVCYVIEREEHSDGTVTVTESVQFTEMVNRTYPQNWAAYNKAQTGEKDTFQSLLHDLCQGISEPEAQKTGRPRLPISDAVFSAVFKIYSTVSGRRFMSDLRQAKERGFVTRTPHYNSIFNYLENPGLTPILQGLITETSLPLTSVEVDFAADSSGFMTSRFTRWYDHKYRGIQEHDWVKCHIMCGVKTNIVTAVVIKDRDASDTKQLPAMILKTSENFKMREISADRGYGSINNTRAVVAAGATPFIAFKSIHTGKGGGLWQKMYHYFMYRREEFLSHYHKRSNVETTFSMIKRKFGDSLRSKTDTAMVNETLCKIVCHNIVVLIHEMHELGIEPDFWQNAEAA